MPQAIRVVDRLADLTDFHYLTPSGGDDSANLQALISTNCDILLGPGTFLWNTAVVTLPRSATGIRIRGSGVGVTTIQLSSSAPRAFDFNKIANFDTFQNITISDLTVDANNVTGKHHGIIGTYRNGGLQNRLSFKNILIERVKGINAQPPDATATNDYRWLMIWTQGDSGDQQMYVNNVVCRDVHLTGGAYGIGIVTSRLASTTGNYANVEFDEILVENCHHDCGVVPTQFVTAANFHLVSRGYGKSVRIRNCYGFNSADVGIEVDSTIDFVAENCRITDQWGIAFLALNGAAPPNLDGQRYLWEGCVARRKAQTTSLTATTCGFRSTIDTEFTSNYVTSMVLRDCKYHKDDGTFHINGEGILIDSTRHIDVDGFEAIYESINFAENVTNYTPSTIRVRNGVGAGAMGTCFFKARDIYMRLRGNRSGSATVLYKPILIGNTGALEFNVDGFAMDFNVTNLTSTAYRGFYIGESAAGQTTNGRLRNMRFINLLGDVSPRAFGLEDTAFVTVSKHIEIIDSDFSNMVGGSGGTEVIFATSGGGSAQNTKIIARNCRIRPGSTALQGAVASAATVTLPPQGELQVVTGTTTITSVTAVPLERRVTFQFTNAAPGGMTDGSNLKLAGDFAGNQNDTITIIYDGTNWVEVCRSGDI